MKIGEVTGKEVSRDVDFQKKISRVRKKELLTSKWQFEVNKKKLLL